MDDHWERSIPFFQIDRNVANLLFRRFDPSPEIESITPIGEGCRNTNYVLRLKAKPVLFLLRIFPLDDRSWEKEESLFNLLQREIPMPRLYFTAQDDTIGGRVYAIYEYIDGISMERAVRAGWRPDDTMMAELAKTLAVIHRHSYRHCGFLDQRLEVETRLPSLESWYDLFLGQNAKERLGSALTDRLRRLLAGSREEMQRMDQRITLTHGDFRPANLLVREGRLRCVLDWEFAMAGHHYSDIGQLFRREEDFTARQKRRWAEIYQEESGFILPDRWEQSARLRDLANLLQMINGDGETPRKYMDLKHLIGGILADAST